MVWTVKKFQQYLYGVDFTLQMDHQPLIYIDKAKFENGRVMRWALVFQNYRIPYGKYKGM